MKEITVISGKGGTGKTSLVGSFAALSGKNAVLVDGDVDAANLGLILAPDMIEEYTFRASKEAVIDPALCTECGLCRDLCRFNAVDNCFAVNPIACEGCAFCFYACPQNAVSMQEVVSGHWYVSTTRHGILVHARLGIAAENSGRLVTTIRSRAAEIASQRSAEYIVIDGPPGIGCPVIASLSGVDLALLVTEPTLSGMHDLKRILDVCRHFKVPAAVCINRCDLNLANTETIERYCREENVPLVGKIPFDPIFVTAMVQGVSVVEHADGPISDSIIAIWEKIK